LHRVRARIIPEMPDFYGLLVEQCEVTAGGTAALVAFLRECREELGDEVRRLEHEGDRLKLRNLETLHRSFSTPMDREDFYQAVEAVDQILNYAKAAVAEVKIFGLAPDPQAVLMAEGVRSGTAELLAALRLLEHEPLSADARARAALKWERRVEKSYRAALAELFDPVRLAADLGPVDPEPAEGSTVDPPTARMLALMSRVFKRREVYRHLSNAADHVARAARIVEDIVAKGS
jgi:uncharacterized protein Yka (UPF0111/DUF47 family)